MEKKDWGGGLGLLLSKLSTFFPMFPQGFTRALTGKKKKPAKKGRETWPSCNFSETKKKKLKHLIWGKFSIGGGINAHKKRMSRAPKKKFGTGWKKNPPLSR